MRLIFLFSTLHTGYYSLWVNAELYWDHCALTELWLLFTVWLCPTLHCLCKRKTLYPWLLDFTNECSILVEAYYIENWQAFNTNETHDTGAGASASTFPPYLSLSYFRVRILHPTICTVSTSASIQWVYCVLNRTS